MHSSISHSSAPSGDGDRLIGQMLDSRLRVLRCIGRGGMGTVYVAEHIGLGKQVAVKVLNAPYASQPDVVARLHSEARHAAAIASEHIVDVFDVGLTDSGQPYVVMELLQGESLAERLRRCTALSELDTLHIGRQLASALSAAHRSGIVHRDIKPENIFLCHRAGRDFVKLLDFGISKAVGPAGEGATEPVAALAPLADERAGSPAQDRPQSASTSSAADTHRAQLQVSQDLLQRLTRTGAILGTPLYMSPEQARGERLDSRCDIYSLGVVLYECLTGSVPFLATSYFGVIAKILTETPDPPSLRIPDRALSAALEQIVLRAMAPDRSERYQTMEALLADLDRYQRGEPIQALALARSSGRATARSEVADDSASQGRGPLGWLWPLRRDRGPLPLLLPLLAGTLVVLLLGGLLVFWRGPQPQHAQLQPALPTPPATQPTAQTNPQQPTVAASAASGPDHLVPPSSVDRRLAEGTEPLAQRAGEPLPSRPLPNQPILNQTLLNQPAPNRTAPNRTLLNRTLDPSKRQVADSPTSRPAPLRDRSLANGKRAAGSMSLSPQVPMPPGDEQAPNPFVTHTP